VGGQRPYNNNFTVEGVDNNNKSVTGNLITVPNDAVENFTLLANQFNTEFGHSSGGQFNTTIRVGRTLFHGSLYEYFRNRHLNAVDNGLCSFITPRLPVHRTVHVAGTGAQTHCQPRQVTIPEYSYSEPWKVFVPLLIVVLNCPPRSGQTRC